MPRGRVDSDEDGDVDHNEIPLRSRTRSNTSYKYAPSQKSKKIQRKNTAHVGKKTKNFRAVAAVLKPIRQGKEVENKNQRRRSANLNLESEIARDDDTLALTLQRNNAKRIASQSDSERVQNKKARNHYEHQSASNGGILKEVAITVLQDKKALCIVCRSKFNIDGGNLVRHFSRHHQSVHKLYSAIIESNTDYSTGVSEMKAHLFDVMCKEGKLGMFRQSRIQEHLKGNLPNKDSVYRIQTAYILELCMSGRGFNHLQSSASKLKWAALRTSPLLPTTARRLFAHLINFVKDRIATELSDGVSVNVTADGWSSRGNEVIGITCHWVRKDWSVGRMMVDLIDIEGFPATGANCTQAVLIAIQERFPDNVQLFVTTTDNASPARLMGDALAGGGGWGCVCHLLSLIVKTDIFENSDSGKAIAPIFNKIRGISTYINQHKLCSELEKIQRDMGINERYVRQIQDENSTRWHSSLYMLESCNVLAPVFQKMRTEMNIKEAEVPSLNSGERFIIRSIIPVLDIVRKASRQLESSKVPTMSRCGPTVVAMMEKLDEFNRCNTDAADVAKEMSKDIIIATWNRFKDSLLKVSWITISMSFSPSFADLSFVHRAWIIAKRLKLTTVKEPDLSALRKKIVERIVYESKATQINETDSDSANGGDRSGSDDSDDARVQSAFIHIALKQVASIAQRRIRVEADTLLNIPCCIDSELNSFKITDDLRFWSLLEYIATGNIQIVISESKELISDVTDAENLLSKVYDVHDKPKFYRIMSFVREHIQLVKSVLMIQASSAESERFFSFAKLCKDMAPSRELRTIGDMAFVKSYFESIGFEDRNLPSNCTAVLDQVSHRIHSSIEK